MASCPKSNRVCRDHKVLCAKLYTGPREVVKQESHSRGYFEGWGRKVYNLHASARLWARSGVSFRGEDPDLCLTLGTGPSTIQTRAGHPMKIPLPLHVSRELAATEHQIAISSFHELTQRRNMDLLTLTGAQLRRTMGHVWGPVQ